MNVRTKPAITNLSQGQRDHIRSAVSLAVRFWPNSHLGAYSSREDMRAAFSRIRMAAPVTGLHNAITSVEIDAYRHEDM